MGLGLRRAMCACESAGEQIDPRVLYLGKATICWRRGCRETEEMEVMRTRRNETRRQAGDEQDVGTSRGPELLRVPRHLYILFHFILPSARATGNLYRANE